MFEMVGEDDILKTTEFFHEYNRKKSIVLEPHSISVHRMVFHVHKWHDINEPKAYWFKFLGNESFKVDILYDQISPGFPFSSKGENIDIEKQLLKENFTIFSYADNLVLKGGEWYTHHFF
jgi:hypothetical protein